MSTFQKIIPFIWIANVGHEAADYYVDLFPDAKIVDSNPTVITIELFGQQYSILNGGPHHPLNDAVSFMVKCKDQAEVDYYWDRIIGDGGTESRCGWLHDKYEVRWQIIPDGLVECITHPDQEKARKATEVMFTQSKIILADILAAVQ